jgi:alpha-D-ribose 1-methylphosphonate 5-triphosphate synthase subunit PhnG
MENSQSAAMPADPPPTQRQRWMAALANAAFEELRALAGREPLPDHVALRAPETGLVMVRGRIGGTGAPFNVGEMTVTRCSVRLADGTIGHGFVAGRDGEHARLAAVLDAMLQDSDDGEALFDRLIVPLETRREARLRERRAKSAATKVDFFTMVRGDV